MIDFCLIVVLPDALRAANITLRTHWAEPLFSKCLIPFIDWEPKIINGNLFFEKNCPNFFKGIVILEKSLLDKLLSPISLFLFDLISKPKINHTSVPELPAFKTRFFVKPLIHYHDFTIVLFFYLYS